MITKFKEYKLNETMISHDTTELVDGKFLSLDRLKNGDLKISTTTEGKSEIKDSGINEFSFSDYFDDIRANSSLLYFDDISEIGFATQAPGITVGYYYDEDGEFTDDGNEKYSEVFYYNEYAYKNFTEELENYGQVVFSSTGISTSEELEERKLKNAANKFNL